MITKYFILSMVVVSKNDIDIHTYIPGGRGLKVICSRIRVDIMNVGPRPEVPADE